MHFSSENYVVTDIRVLARRLRPRELIIRKSWRSLTIWKKKYEIPAFVIFSWIYILVFNWHIAECATWSIWNTACMNLMTILIDRWCLSAKKSKHLHPLQQKVICHRHHHHMMKLMACLPPLLLIRQLTLSTSSWERCDIFTIYKDSMPDVHEVDHIWEAYWMCFLYSLWCRRSIPSRLRVSLSLTYQLATSLSSGR